MSLVRVQLPEPKISRKLLCLQLFLNLTLQYLHIPRHTKTRHKTPIWLHRTNNGNPTCRQAGLLRRIQHKFVQMVAMWKNEPHKKL